MIELNRSSRDKRSQGEIGVNLVLGASVSHLSRSHKINHPQFKVKQENKMSAPNTFDEATKIAADPNILKVSYSDKQKL